MSISRKLSKKKERELGDFITRHMYQIQHCGDLDHFELSTMYWMKPNETCEMEINVDHKYLGFELGINLNRMYHLYDGKEYNKIITTICHELTHIITTENSDLVKHKKGEASRTAFYNERETEFFSRYLYRLYLEYMKSWDINIKTGMIGKKYAK